MPLRERGILLAGPWGSSKNPFSPAGTRIDG
jgi:hypothetical protein